MNFLAHLFLSGDDPKIMTGNFLGDFVKGKAALQLLDPVIVKGIELHRAIDLFTDSHAVVRLSKNRLREKYRHYSGVIVDMFYDHLLAADWNEYHGGNLPAFAQEAYHTLRRFEPVFPERAKQVLPYIIQGNWLVGYASMEGIARALTGMARRSKHDSKMDEAVTDLKLNYEQFADEFRIFFPELIDFSNAWLREHLVPGENL